MYHKIQSVFKRKQVKGGEFIVGEYTSPEFEYLKDNEWEWTEKIDGINIRICLNEEGVVFGGRTEAASIPAHLVTRLNELFYTTPRQKLLREVFEGEWKDITLFGEGFGHKIQNGGLYLGKEVDFCLFDIRIGKWWLERGMVEHIANELGLRFAPVVGRGTIDESIEYVKGAPDSVFGTAKSEGLVIRPTVELTNRAGHRVITKIKVRDFIFKQKP